MMASIYLDKDSRENILKQVKDNKQFNIYPNNFAEQLIEELQGGKYGITNNN